MNPGLIPFSWKLAGGWRSALIAALAFVRSGGCSGLAQGLADRFKSWAEKNTIPHGVVPELIGSGVFFFRTPSFLWLLWSSGKFACFVMLWNKRWLFFCLSVLITKLTSRDPKPTPHFFQRNSGGQRTVLSSCLFDRQSGSYLRRASKETRGCPRMGYPKNQPGLPYHNISQ